MAHLLVAALLAVCGIWAGAPWCEMEPAKMSTANNFIGGVINPGTAVEADRGRALMEHRVLDVNTTTVEWRKPEYLTRTSFDVMLDFSDSCISCLFEQNMTFYYGVLTNWTRNSECGQQATNKLLVFDLVHVASYENGDGCFKAMEVFCGHA